MTSSMVIVNVEEPSSFLVNDFVQFKKDIIIIVKKLNVPVKTYTPLRDLALNYYRAYTKYETYR